MRILITGAFGFVGTNLAAYLAARGHYLIALDVVHQESSAYSECFSWEQFDRLDWESVDAVVHLAGKAHDTRNASDSQSYFDVNVGLTKKVIERFSRKDAKTQREEMGRIKKFILFSSVKAVADQVTGVLTEEAVPDPKTPYGQSKLEAEREVLKFGSAERSSKIRECVSSKGDECEDEESNFSTLAPQNFRTYILRPCMIHGPGNRGNLNLLYKIVQKGIPWPLGAFENRRSFASIDNVCAVVDGLLTGDGPSGVYQVADDETLSTNELIGLIAEATGRRARIWKVPAGWMHGVARVGDVLRLPLNSERLKKLTESYVASNEKIKEVLGWKAMPIRAEDGMRKTLTDFSRKGAKTLRGSTL